MLKVENLNKYYGKLEAIKNINFYVKNSEIAVLLGPNGAGKSTTIKCISGLLRYKGRICMNNLGNKDVNAKKIFSYVPETPALFDMLTVKEHVDFFCKAYGIVDYEQNMNELFKRFDLLDKQDKLGKELSKGMQQKVSICCALITEPKIILFDEPMIGLDPKAIKELKKIFIELKKKSCSVLISTHIIDSIEEVWDRVLIMHKGDIVSVKTRSDIEESKKKLEDIFFEVTGD